MIRHFVRIPQLFRTARLIRTAIVLSLCLIVMTLGSELASAVQPVASRHHFESTSTQRQTLSHINTHTGSIATTTGAFVATSFSDGSGQNYPALDGVTASVSSPQTFTLSAGYGPSGGLNTVSINFGPSGTAWTEGTYSTNSGSNIGLSGSLFNCSGGSVQVAVDINNILITGSNTLASIGVQFSGLCMFPSTSPNADEEISGTIALNDPNTTPGQGYYLFDQYGDTYGFGNDSYLTYLGNPGYLTLNAPIVGMATTPDGAGYWMVAADGGIFSYGDAAFYGSAGNLTLNKPIVGMAATPDGKGYWFVASDGGIFSYGDATFYGSMGGKPLNQPIVGMAASANGSGYYLVASDGGVFSFGATPSSAPFYGSMGGKTLNSPITGMVLTSNGQGYWQVASDGGMFSFGNAQFFGSLGGTGVTNVVGMVR